MRSIFSCLLPDLIFFKDKKTSQTKNIFLALLLICFFIASSPLSYAQEGLNYDTSQEIKLGTLAPHPLQKLWGEEATDVDETTKKRYAEWVEWQRISQSVEEETNYNEFKNMPAPVQKQWGEAKKRYKQTTDPVEKLRLVSDFFNLWPSIADSQLYNKDEYWATAAEFISNSGGDCEDFAIAKYTALIRLGWPSEDLWLILVYDLSRKNGHAVLAAKAENNIYILDNLSVPKNLVMPIDFYAPIYKPMAIVNNHSFLVFPTTNEKIKVATP